MTSPFRAVLFDFDGTLADSYAAIAASTNHVRSRFGLPELPELEIRRYVGYGLANLLERLAPTAPLDEAIALYREHHERVMISETRLLPGVAETVAELARRGYRLGVCSNKRVEFTRQLVDALGLGATMRCVLGPDDVAGRAKPDPAMLLEGLSRLKVSAAEALYIGDMVVDVQTAQAAGVAVWIVPGGAVDPAPAIAAGPNRMLKTFAEMLELLPPVTS
jgi:phosphoglycolate phosphatase